MIPSWSWMVRVSPRTSGPSSRGFDLVCFRSTGTSGVSAAAGFTGSSTGCGPWSRMSRVYVDLGPFLDFGEFSQCFSHAFRVAAFVGILADGHDPVFLFRFFVPDGGFTDVVGVLNFLPAGGGQVAPELIGADRVEGVLVGDDGLGVPVRVAHFFPLFVQASPFSSEVVGGTPRGFCFRVVVYAVLGRRRSVAFPVRKSIVNTPVSVSSAWVTIFVQCLCRAFSKAAPVAFVHDELDSRTNLSGGVLANRICLFSCILSRVIIIHCSLLWIDFSLMKLIQSLSAFPVVSSVSALLTSTPKDLVNKFAYFGARFSSRKNIIPFLYPFLEVASSQHLRAGYSPFFGDAGSVL